MDENQVPTARGGVRRLPRQEDEELEPLVLVDGDGQPVGSIQDGD